MARITAQETKGCKKCVLLQKNQKSESQTEPEYSFSAKAQTREKLEPEHSPRTSGKLPQTKAQPVLEAGNWAGKGKELDGQTTAGSLGGGNSIMQMKTRHCRTLRLSTLHRKS